MSTPIEPAALALLRALRAAIDAAAPGRRGYEFSSRNRDSHWPRSVGLNPRQYEDAMFGGLHEPIRTDTPHSCAVTAGGPLWVN